MTVETPRTPPHSRVHRKGKIWPDGVPSSYYRVGPGEGGRPKWNPYAADQSREHRVRAARTRASYPDAAGSNGAALRTVDARGYYALLGVEPGAGVAEIERAYRRAIASIHPDKFHGDPERRSMAEEQVKRLNAAMVVLRDGATRAEYDAGKLR